jgi:hypothetical protein
MLGDVFHFHCPDDLVEKIVTTWRKTSLAGDEYTKLTALAVSQVANSSSVFATGGLSRAACAAAAFVGDKIGLPVKKAMDACEAFQPGKIVEIFFLVLVGVLMNIRKEAHESGRTARYESAIVARIPPACQEFQSNLGQYQGFPFD